MNSVVLSKRICPICNNNESEILFDHSIETFDAITFNRHVLVVGCNKCGFVYNDFSINTGILEQYYQDVTLYSGETGCGHGGGNSADKNRYLCYLRFINPFLQSKDIVIADVGCAKGGFLSFLKSDGFTRLAGVEIDPKCVEYARNIAGLDVKRGSLHDLPFGDGEIDLLVYNNVLEHLDNPIQALKEAKRVLKDDGMIFIEVPDASRYSAGRVFDYYWFCMQEHINHFDNIHLNMLMEMAGFAKITEHQSLIPYNSTYSYPSLCALFRNKSQPETKELTFSDKLKHSMQSYINAENAILDVHKKQISALIEKNSPVYVWGISLEFFSLYSLAGLRDCNILGLIDKSIVKLANTVNNMVISPPELLNNISSDAVVVITSVLHQNEMTDYLKQNGFDGQVVTFESPL